MTKYVYVDCESTGLIPGIHQPYEVSLSEDGINVSTYVLEHSVKNADPQALQISGYYERSIYAETPTPYAALKIASRLNGATLVGANVAFDAAMLTAYLGFAPWHYRLFDVEVFALGVMGPGIFLNEEIPGLRRIAGALNDHGANIPLPDHTSAGDVITTAAVHQALMNERYRVHRGGVNL